MPEKLAKPHFSNCIRANMGLPNFFHWIQIWWLIQLLALAEGPTL